MRTEPKVAVVGLGYVGLVTGACLAHIGHRVACVDKDGSRVAALESGRTPLYEPPLEELVENNGSRLCFTTELSKVVQATDVIFVCVGTPSKKDGTADLTNVVSVARQVGRSPGLRRASVRY